jgi:hypothetical protein
MKLKRKKVGWTLFVDGDGNVLGKKPKYDFVLEESLTKRIITSKELYITLIYPILISFLIYYTPITKYKVGLSILLGLLLSLTIKILKDIIDS